MVRVKLASTASYPTEGGAVNGKLPSPKLKERWKGKKDSKMTMISVKLENRRRGGDGDG